MNDNEEDDDDGDDDDIAVGERNPRLWPPIKLPFPVAECPNLLDTKEAAETLLMRSANDASVNDIPIQR